MSEERRRSKTGMRRTFSSIKGKVTNKSSTNLDYSPQTEADSAGNSPARGSSSGGGAGLASPNGVFGVSLRRVIDLQGDSARGAEELLVDGENLARFVPKIVVDCVEWLRDTPKALETDGLFRIPGQKGEVDAIRALYTSPDHDVDIPRDAEVEAVASVLKLYFRELPEPPIDEMLYPAVVGVAKDEALDDADRLEQLKILVSKLENPDAAVFRYLIEFLAEVAAYSEENMMTADNLSVCWAPNLLRSESAEDSMFDAVHVNRAIAALIDDPQAQARAHKRHDQRTNAALQLLAQKKALAREIDSPKVGKRLKHVEEDERHDASSPFIEGGSKAGRAALPRSTSRKKITPAASSPPAGNDSTSSDRVEELDRGAGAGLLASLGAVPKAAGGKNDTTEKPSKLSNWDYDHRSASSSDLLASEKEELKAMGKRLIKDPNFVIGPHKYGQEGTVFEDSFSGLHAVDFLVACKMAADRDSAVEKLSKMTQHGYIEHVTEGGKKGLKDSSAEFYVFHTRNTTQGRGLRRDQSSQRSLDGSSTGSADRSGVSGDGPAEQEAVRSLGRSDGRSKSEKFLPERGSHDKKGSTWSSASSKELLKSDPSDGAGAKNGTSGNPKSESKVRVSGGSHGRKRGKATASATLRSPKTDRSSGTKNEHTHKRSASSTSLHKSAEQLPLSDGSPQGEKKPSGGSVRSRSKTSRTSLTGSGEKDIEKPAPRVRSKTSSRRKSVGGEEDRSHRGESGGTKHHRSRHHKKEHGPGEHGRKQRHHSKRDPDLDAEATEAKPSAPTPQSSTNHQDGWSDDEDSTSCDSSSADEHMEVMRKKLGVVVPKESPATKGVQEAPASIAAVLQAAARAAGESPPQAAPAKPAPTPAVEGSRDAHGVLRGFCEECGEDECDMYSNPNRPNDFACAYCGCLPVKHRREG